MRNNNHNSFSRTEKYLIAGILIVLGLMGESLMSTKSLAQNKFDLVKCSTTQGCIEAKPVGVHSNYAQKH